MNNESSPKPAAAAISEIRQRYADSSKHLVNWWDSDIKVLLLEIQRLEAAAIQRGDGQTKQTESPHKHVLEYDGAFSCFDCKAKWGALPGHPKEPPSCVTTPPAAKPNETSGATPSNKVRAEAVAHLVFPLAIYAGEEFKHYRAIIKEQVEAELNAVRKSSGAAGAEDANELATVAANAWYPESPAIAKVLAKTIRAHMEPLLAKGTAAKSTPGVSGLSALDFTRLRDWFADPQRKSAMLAFTAGPARDAAAAFESAVKHEVPREADQEQAGGAT